MAGGPRSPWRFSSSDRAETNYSWDARGWLRGISEDNAQGTTETKLSVNAFGELTVVNDTRLRWDIAAGVPSLLDVDGTSVFTGPAGVTGIETSWQNHCGALLGGSDTQDQTLAAVSAHAGVCLGTDGSLQIAGLEWMGARAYDPASASFLSQDPLAAPLGASWTANPYSYAGNDPLHAIDPHGLAPITDDELQAYADGLQGPMASGLSSAWEGADITENWANLPRDRHIFRTIPCYNTRAPDYDRDAPGRCTCPGSESKIAGSVWQMEIGQVG